MISLGMARAQPLDHRRVDRPVDLAQQLIGEQPAAHPDLAMDAQDRERDIRRSQRLVPREHVLIHAVDQRPVEIEEEGIAYHRRSEEHTSELQSLMRNSYAVLCLKKTKKTPEDT